MLSDLARLCGGSLAAEASWRQLVLSVTARQAQTDAQIMDIEIEPGATATIKRLACNRERVDARAILQDANR